MEPGETEITTHPEGIPIPPEGSAQRWCWEVVVGEELSAKLVAPGSEVANRWEENAPARRLEKPGRPPELRVVSRAGRRPGYQGLERPEARAHLVHTFFHHELQAIELFAWAILAFPETPLEFREGLLRLAGEEIVHAKLYAGHLESLGSAIGSYPVRDWFWQRGGQCADATAFVAFLGLGLEGANLDHNRRFAGLFREAGDEEGARILERVESDEVNHVAFAIRWFEHFTGAPLDYDRWCAALPAPLTPAVLQGRPVNREARGLAGQDDIFLDRLEAEPPATTRRAK